MAKSEETKDSSNDLSAAGKAYLKAAEENKVQGIVHTRLDGTDHKINIRTISAKQLGILKAKKHPFVK